MPVKRKIIIFLLFVSALVLIFTTRGVLPNEKPAHAPLTSEVTAAEAVLPSTALPPVTQSEPLSTAAPPVNAIPGEEIWQKYMGISPSAWGYNLDGIISIIPTDEKIIALTFDACKGDYDAELIEFLIAENVPATLFISGRWIGENPGKLEYLASRENFSIENHGYEHRPLSVSGRSEYGVEGTASPGEIFNEIELNARRIEELTGRRPVFFRSGTAFYDDIAVQIARDMGVPLAGYTISGDGGATLSKAQILKACGNPPPGAILLFHMNHPESDTYEGVRALYEILVEKGYSFVNLSSCIIG